MKRIIKFSLALTVLVFFILTIVQYNNTKYTYLDVVKLKGSVILSTLKVDMKLQDIENNL